MRKLGYANIVLGACSVLALTACGQGEVQDTLGLSRTAPDEFRVVSRPPLSVPPEFNLRPPGDIRDAAPTVQPAHAKAESLLIEDGQNDLFVLPSNDKAKAVPVQAAQPKPVASAEAQLLQKAGAGIADSSVRDKLREEVLQRTIQKEEEDWMDEMLSFGDEDAEPVVNPKGEAERIKTNKAEGKPASEGEIVQSDPKKRSVIDRIFGE